MTDMILDSMQVAACGTSYHDIMASWHTHMHSLHNYIDDDWQGSDGKFILVYSDVYNVGYCTHIPNTFTCN